MSDCRERLVLKHGRRDIIDTLDEVRERAVAGEVDGILLVVLGGEPDEDVRNLFAWKKDMRFCWSRFTAAVSAAEFQLNSEGLEDETE